MLWLFFLASVFVFRWSDFRKSSSRGLSKGVSKGAVPGAPVLDDGTAAVFLQQKHARKEELVVGLPLVV